MKNKKLYVILKYVLIILMIVLIIVMQNFKTNDCAYCRFDIDSKTVKIGKFMEVYSGECLQVRGVDLLDFGGEDEG